MTNPTPARSALRDHVAWLMWNTEQGYFTDEDRGPDNWMLRSYEGLHPDDIRDRERFRAAASALLAAISEHLAERGLLLGPDGLVKAERAGIYRVIEWSREGLPLDATVQWIDECDRLDGDDLIVLIPQDPTEEP